MQRILQHSHPEPGYVIDTYRLSRASSSILHMQPQCPGLSSHSMNPAIPPVHGQAPLWLPKGPAEFTQFCFWLLRSSFCSTSTRLGGTKSAPSVGPNCPPSRRARGSCARSLGQIHHPSLHLVTPHYSDSVMETQW